MIRALAAAIVLAVPLTAAAQGEAPEADSREAHARAMEAVSRSQRLETRGEALPLHGEAFAIQGLGLAVAGAAQDIGGLLRELNAEVRGKQVRIALAADVLFDFDKAELKAGAAPSLAKVAAVLKSYPKATARIEGHTDSKGERAYNQKLSERRAETVRKHLAAQGATLRMSTRGWGEKKPVAPNSKPDGRDDPEGRQKNRRVEITVQQL